MVPPGSLKTTRRCGTSTRTRASFDLAGRRLGAHVINLDTQSSSRVKGETVTPTGAAIVTTVEPVHLEFFDSVEEIAEAKAEIFTGLEPRGAAILNRDNVHYERLALRARQAGAVNIIGFGEDPAGSGGRADKYLGIVGAAFRISDDAVLHAIDCIAGGNHSCGGGRQFAGWQGISRDAHL